MVLAQRTWSVPDASTDAVQAARAHEKALGAARLEAKEAREAHGALEKECAAKDEIERVTSAAAEHDPAKVQQCQASHASQLDELGERFEACLAANRLLDEQLCSLRLKAQAQVTELLQLRAVRIVKITAVSTFWSAKTRDF